MAESKKRQRPEDDPMTLWALGAPCYNWTYAVHSVRDLVPEMDETAVRQSLDDHMRAAREAAEYYLDPNSPITVKKVRETLDQVKLLTDCMFSHMKHESLVGTFILAIELTMVTTVFMCNRVLAPALRGGEECARMIRMFTDRLMALRSTLKVVTSSRRTWLQTCPADRPYNDPLGWDLKEDRSELLAKIYRLGNRAWHAEGDAIEAWFATSVQPLLERVNVLADVYIQGRDRYSPAVSDEEESECDSRPSAAPKFMEPAIVVPSEPAEEVRPPKRQARERLLGRDECEARFAAVYDRMLEDTTFRGNYLEVNTMIEREELNWSSEILYDMNKPAEAAQVNRINRAYNAMAKLALLFAKNPDVVDTPDDILKMIEGIRFPNSSYDDFRAVVRFMLKVNLPADATDFPSFIYTPGFLTPPEVSRVLAQAQANLPPDGQPHIADQDIRLVYMGRVIDIQKGQPIPRILLNFYHFAPPVKGMIGDDVRFSKMERDFARPKSAARVLEMLNAFLTENTVCYKKNKERFLVGHFPAWSDTEGASAFYDETDDSIKSDSYLPPLMKTWLIPVKKGYDHSKPDDCIYPVVTYEPGIEGFAVHLSIPEHLCMAAGYKVLLPETYHACNMAGLLCPNSPYSDQYALGFEFSAAPPKKDAKDPGKVWKCCTTLHCSLPGHRKCGVGVGSEGFLCNCTCLRDQLFGTNAPSGTGLQPEHYLSVDTEEEEVVPSAAPRPHPYYIAGSCLPHVHIQLQKPGGITGYDFFRFVVVEHRVRAYVEWNYDSYYNQEMVGADWTWKPTDKNDNFYYVTCRCQSFCQRAKDSLKGKLRFNANPHWSAVEGNYNTYTGYQKRKAQWKDGAGPSAVEEEVREPSQPPIEASAEGSVSPIPQPAPKKQRQKKQAQGVVTGGKKPPVITPERRQEMQREKKASKNAARRQRYQDMSTLEKEIYLANRRARAKYRREHKNKSEPVQTTQKFMKTLKKQFRRSKKKKPEPQTESDRGEGED